MTNTSDANITLSVSEDSREIVIKMKMPREKPAFTPESFIAELESYIYEISSACEEKDDSLSKDH